MIEAQRVARDLAQDVERLLSRLGLLCRVFNRAKETNAVLSKIKSKNYSATGSKLQDLIGIRIALYFADDVSITERALQTAFSLCGSTKDEPETDTFRPTRLNLIFKIPDTSLRELSILKTNSEIDATFEVQLRTILAEGWHEVEHDLRYKSPSDWSEHADLARTMNGIVATLETCDWSMLQLFDELSLRHYRAQEWVPMLRHKFRLRLSTEPLRQELGQLFRAEPELAKRFFRMERGKLLLEMIARHISLPLTASNLIFIANELFIHDSRISNLMPQPVAMAFES